MKSVLYSINPEYCEMICRKIGEDADGKPIYKKSVELRKKAPKLSTPHRAFIYCTKNGGYLYKQKETELIQFSPAKWKNEILLSQNLQMNGKVIGEFICDNIEEYSAEFCDFEYSNCMNKNCALNQILKVVGYDHDDKMPLCQFESSNEMDNPDDCELARNSNLTFNEIRNYIGETFFDNLFYGLHISDLIIYDKPKELRAFRVVDNEAVKECPYRERIYNNPDLTNGALLLGSYLCRDKTNWCTKCKTKPLTRPPQSWCYVEVLR